MKFLDQAKIYITSGKGGRGCVSFRREKYIEHGGPNGGNGGKGGDIILITDPNLNTLIDFRYQQHFKAKKGGDGKGQNRTGAGGNDLIIKVPPGTEVYNDDKSVLLADLTKKDQKITMAVRVVLETLILNLQQTKLLDDLHMVGKSMKNIYGFL
jgi:GTP-binding protein